MREEPGLRARRLVEEARQYLPDFIGIGAVAGPFAGMVCCTLCCAMVPDGEQAREHHSRFHAELWRVFAGVPVFSEEERAGIRAFFAEVDR